MNKKESAVATFSQGYACSQAVFATFARELGMNQETALRVSAGFGGGLGRQGDVCGAVSGAVMAIGLRYGASQAHDTDAKEYTYLTVKEFCRQFKLRHKSVHCRELLGCDISTEEGMTLAKQSKLFITQCPKYVGDAAEILDNLVG